MISEKNILQTDFEGEKFARIYLAKIISCPEKNFPNDVYSAEKKLTPLYVREKCLAPEVWEKKNLAQTKSPISPPPAPPPLRKVKWATTQGVGKKPANLTPLVDVIRQQNGWRTFIMWWFSRLKFCISRLKIRRKKTQVERQISSECSDSFLRANESFSL